MSTGLHARCLPCAAMSAQPSGAPVHLSTCVPCVAPPCSVSTRSSELQDELRNAQAEAEAAAQGRTNAEAAAARLRQDLRTAQEQLEAARRGRAQAVEEAAELQGKLAEMEASAALYIAKEVGGRPGMGLWDLEP